MWGGGRSCEVIRRDYVNLYMYMNFTMYISKCLNKRIYSGYQSSDPIDPL